MEPDPKAPTIRRFIDAILGKNIEECIRNNVCAMCDEPALHFKDAVSRKEYAISGMCQKCQDELENAFGIEMEDENE